MLKHYIACFMCKLSADNMLEKHDVLFLPVVDLVVTNRVQHQEKAVTIVTLGIMPNKPEQTV